MFRFLFFSFFLLPGSIVLGQLRMEGRVADSRQLTPLAEVSIQANGQPMTLSDEQGRFSFSVPGQGAVILVFSAEGYQPVSKRLGPGESLPEGFVVLLQSVEYLTEEILISTTRASEKTATTYSMMDKEAIARINFGQDLPMLLDQLPSTVTNSDAGAGVGYTGLRIRGSDPTRTNVTINGIPLNDAESHGLFWVNLPDLASSVQSIQVQRGVGTSTNGAAAFGASINLETTTLQAEPYVEFANSFGSFNTRKHTLNAGSGLLHDRFAVDVRLSDIQSDGWVDRAFSDLRSYFVSAGYFGKKHLLKALVFSGTEQTYQSWWGIPESYLNDPVLRKSNYYTYDNETDNYTQSHYQLHYTFQPSQAWNIRSSLHYTRGFGYFEQFRDGEDLVSYGLPPLQLVNGQDTITSTDLIRRRWLDNDFYGAIATAQYRPGKQVELTFGGGWNQYDGDHFGEIIWARFAGTSEIRDRYYENRGLKTDQHAFAKAIFDFSTSLSGYVDLQVRGIDYRWGDESLEGAGVDNDQRLIGGEAQYTFFNPRAGLTFEPAPGQQVYASFAVANREPVRADFIDAPQGKTPLPERLQNIEAGYRLEGKTFGVSANLYWMDYQNQLVLTGAINDVGAPIRENVAQSTRTGVELVGNWQMTAQLGLQGNLTLSRNKIEAYTEYIVNYDDFSLIETSYTNTDIAFSPALIAGGQLSYRPWKTVELAWMSKYVGRQYLDNTQSLGRSLDPFWVNDLLLNGSLPCSWAKKLSLGLQVRNLLNELYEPNGYTFSYAFGGETYTENFFYPQAGRHVMVNLVAGF